MIASLESPPTLGNAPVSRQVKRACLQRLMTLMARSSPGLFELVEAWALQDPDNRH